MLAKVLQKVESSDVGVNEMKGDLSSMSELVDLYTTSIKQIEQQLGQLSASLNQRKNGSLPSDTIQNPKKDGHCIAIATRSCKIINDLIFAEAFDEEEMGATIEERLVVETLAALLMNFEADFQTDYVETINALQGMGAHFYAPN
uniref:Integrase core domain containing protein n=1 Tax=Solanum tuberosum TaxID=4113 RepID=M1DN90_SOLTU